MLYSSAVARAAEPILEPGRWKSTYQLLHTHFLSRQKGRWVFQNIFPVYTRANNSGNLLGLIYKIIEAMLLGTGRAALPWTMCSELFQLVHTTTRSHNWKSRCVSARASGIHRISKQPEIQRLLESGYGRWFPERKSIERLRALTEKPLTIYTWSSLIFKITSEAFGCHSIASREQRGTREQPSWPAEREMQAAGEGVPPEARSSRSWEGQWAPQLPERGISYKLGTPL